MSWKPVLRPQSRLHSARVRAFATMLDLTGLPLPRPRGCPCGARTHEIANACCAAMLAGLRRLLTWWLLPRVTIHATLFRRLDPAGSPHSFLPGLSSCLAGASPFVPAFASPSTEWTMRALVGVGVRRTFHRVCTYNDRYDGTSSARPEIMMITGSKRLTYAGEVVLATYLESTY